MSRARPTLVVLLLAGLSALSVGAETPRTLVEVVASKRVFLPQTVTLQRGEPVTLVVRNEDEDLHAFVPLLLFQRVNVQIAGNGAPEFNEYGLVRVLIPPHGRAELSFTPKTAGTFVFICDLPGHDMRALIVVQEPTSPR